MQQVLQRRAAASDAVRARRPPQSFAYGPSPIERLDVYAAAAARGARHGVSARRRLAGRRSP